MKKFYMDAEALDGVCIVEPIAHVHDTPIHWMLSLDISGSMTSEITLPSGKSTRWDLVTRVLETLAEKLRMLRPSDLITIITFNHVATCVVKCKSVQTLDMAAILKVLTVDGLTNVSGLFEELAFQVGSNVELKDGTHSWIELMVTDGIATSGKYLKDDDIVSHRIELFKNLPAPYLSWNAAISCDGNFRLCRSLSKVTQFGVWAHIKETEMNRLSAEMGLVLGVVLDSSIVKLSEHQTVLVVGNKPNTFYCETKPDNCEILQVSEHGSHLISLFRMWHELEWEPKPNLVDIRKRLEKENVENDEVCKRYKAIISSTLDSFEKPASFEVNFLRDLSSQSQAAQEMSKEFSL